MKNTIVDKFKGRKVAACKICYKTTIYEIRNLTL